MRTQETGGNMICFAQKNYFCKCSFSFFFYAGNHWMLYRTKICICFVDIKTFFFLSYLEFDIYLIGVIQTCFQLNNGFALSPIGIHAQIWPN